MADIAAKRANAEPAKLKPQREPGRWRIGPLLALAFGGSTVVSTVLVLLVIGGVALRSTTELLSARADIVVDSMIVRLQDRLDVPRQQLDYIAKLMRRNGVGFDALSDLREDLAVLVASTSAVAGVTVVGEAGFMVSAIADEPDGPVMARVRPFDPASDEAESIHELRTESLDLGPIWQSPQRLEGTAKAVLPVELSVFDEAGQPLGLVKMLLGLADLSSIISELVIEDDQVPFILLAGKEVLVHPAMASDDHAADAERLLPFVASFSDPVLARWPGRILERRSAEEVQVSEVLVDGERYVFFFREVGAGFLPTVIGAYFPASKVNPDLLRLFGAVAVALLFALVGVVVALMAGRRLSRSIRAVAFGAREAADLDPAALTDIPRSRVQEFDDTGLALKAMGQALQFATRYIPRQLVLSLLARSDDEPRIKSRELTIMFTDLQGFTTRSENLAAEEVAARLNEHFDQVCGAIEAEGGTVDKFLGDGVMAFWGAPDTQPDHAERAVRAAAAIARGVHALAQDRVSRPRLRIGIHTGNVVVGDIGGGSRLNYTIVGDAVNTASRLEGLGKQFPTDPHVVVLVSGDTKAQLTGDWHLVDRGEHEVQGRAAGVRVWELQVD